LEYDSADTTGTGIPLDLELYDQILIHKEVMYQHQTLQVNYTTYDVRRAQDIINPNTTRRDIMVLDNSKSKPQPEKDLDNATSNNKFAYACVIGIFHVNVFLSGSTQPVLNCHPQRLDFLWVRWYDPTTLMHPWRLGKLDRLRFPPMAQEDSFGFINPRDVLRACHIEPAFSAGLVYQDGVGLSGLARDKQDFRSYYVNRCVCL
jgi:hypothetical protein